MWMTRHLSTEPTNAAAPVVPILPSFLAPPPVHDSGGLAWMDCQLGGGGGDGGHGALKHGYNSPVRTNQRGGLLTAYHVNLILHHTVEDFDPAIFTVEPFLSLNLTHLNQLCYPR